MFWVYVGVQKSIKETNGHKVADDTVMVEKIIEESTFEFNLKKQ